MCIRDIKINGVRDPVGFQMQELILSYEADGTPDGDLVAAIALDADCEQIVYKQKLDIRTNYATKLDFVPEPETRYFVFILCGARKSRPCILEGGTRFDCPFITSVEPIGHPVFSKRFSLPGNVTRARLYVTGLGLYEAFVNGEKAGNEYLTPGCNDYSAYVQYQSFDVTDSVREENILEICLGNGWYKGRFGLRHKTEIYGSDFVAAAKLVAWTSDGKRIEILTDESWRARPSFVVDSGIYDGEIVDRTRDISHESPVRLIDRKIPVAERIGLPVVEKHILKPSLIVTPKGERVLDFGQNFAGFVRFSVPMRYGQKLTLKAGEVLQEGCFYNANLRTAKAEFVYISDGILRTVRPQFTFYGLRYLLVEGLGEVDPEAFEGVVIYSDLDASVSIDVGNPKLNRLLANCVWGQRGNFIDVPTDCPQRDERLGWTGDAEIFSRTACFQMDCRAFYHKYLTDMEIDQRLLNGRIASYSPSFKETGAATSVWADAATIVPWNVYTFYGDRYFLQRHYPMMKRYVDTVIAEDDAHGGGRLYNFDFHLGDWLSQDGAGANALKGATSEHFIASVYYYNSVRIVAKAASVLGHGKEAAYYQKIADEIRKAVFTEYFTPSGRLAIDTQTAYVICSEFEIYPNREKFLHGFAKRMKKDGYKIRGGFVGASQLVQNLFKCGFDEDAYRIIFSEEFPGWLYCVNLGATTIWERWNSLNADGSISGTEMNSLNHYSFGAIAEAFYAYIAGIEQRDIAFKKVVVHPRFNYRLPKLKMRFRSPSGEFAVSYRLSETEIDVTVVIPYGVEATFVFGEEELPLSVGTNRLRFRAPLNYKYPYSIDCKLCDLMHNQATQTILSEAVPALYGFLKRNDIGMSGSSLRELCAIDSFHVPDAVLDKINERLEAVPYGDQ